MLVTKTLKRVRELALYCTPDTRGSGFVALITRLCTLSVSKSRAWVNQKKKKKSALSNSTAVWFSKHQADVRVFSFLICSPPDCAWPAMGQQPTGRDPSVPARWQRRASLPFRPWEMAKSSSSQGRYRGNRGELSRVKWHWEQSM